MRTLALVLALAAGAASAQQQPTVTNVSPGVQALNVKCVSGCSGGGGGGVASTVAIDQTGTANDVNISGSVAVTGPVTDAQLRASAVPVSLTSTTVTGTVAVSGPLTDTQLRATAVPVSGTFWQATQPVSGTFWQATQPVSAASLPLPSGAATAAKQPALGTAGTASADVLTVQGIASMTALKVDGSGVTQPVSGPLTDTQLRATAVPVSGTVTVTDGAGALNVIVDSGALTASLSQTGSANDVDVLTLPALTTGSNTIGAVNPNVISDTAADNEGLAVSVTTTSASVLASNTARKFARLCLDIDSTANVHVRLSATAATTSYRKLSPGECLSISAGMGGGTIYTGAISAISASGTQSLYVEAW